MAEAFFDKNGRNVEVHSANHTFAAADSGVVQLIDTDGTTQTLPATAVGMVATFQVQKSGVGVNISPAAADQIIGAGFSAADNKDAILASDDARAGDYITLLADGSSGWYVVGYSGNWTREA